MMTYATAPLWQQAPVGAHPHPWDAAAAGWNHHAALIHDWLHDATQTMLDEAHVGPGVRILDIAAGAGDQTLDIARRVGSEGWVLATDVSPGILALAHKNAKAAGLNQISTQVADAQSLNLEGANFDAAVCRLGLMFCRSPLVALREVRTTLRPQGRFTALVFGPPERNPCVTIALATARQHAGVANVSLTKPTSAYEPGTLMSLGKPGLFQELLQTAGFVDLAVHPVSAPFRAPSAAHYVDFLRSSASPIIEILSLLSAAARQEAWSDMTEQLKVFSTASAWVGPNELLMCVAVSPKFVSH
jgi:ubiquinone/menaquinone biosynthesis C-methylase UbiE